ncbi:MAG: hypothetical protein O2800_00005, partial [Planctomycetota bacterium]|nr:hypothetical protein [Planctomycetota bacterium]
IFTAFPRCTKQRASTHKRADPTNTREHNSRGLPVPSMRGSLVGFTGRPAIRQEFTVPTTRFFLPIFVALTLTLFGNAWAVPQASDVPPAATPEASKNLEMGIHYILVAKGQLAATNLQALLDAVTDDAVLAELVTERGMDDRLEDAIRRGRLLPEVGEIIMLLDARVDAGRLLLARDDARIERSVTNLIGSGRQQVLAQERLIAAGEYAVPRLLRAALDQSNTRLSIAARAMIVKESRMAVAPLCAALSGSDVDSKKEIAQLLGDIGWPAAEPYLLQVAGNTEFPDDVRAAASRSYSLCGGGVGSVSEQFTQLARNYFESLPSVVPYLNDEFNTMWSYDASSGLVADSVPTDIFGSMMAMQLSAEALRVDPSNQAALVTFVASDLRRENRTPDGYQAAERAYNAAFFARLAGVDIASGVLTLALKSGDTALALDAIEALGQVGGAATIVSGEGSPLSKALISSDRRVQFEAALTLAAASPRMAFRNSSLVVPRIASMLETSSNPIGAIVARDEDAQAIASDLSAGGFEPGAFAPSFSQFAADLGALGATVDFVVIHGNRAFIERELSDIRSSAAFGAVPVLLVTGAADLAAVDMAAGDDFRTSVTAAGGGTETLQVALSALLARAAGGAMSADEARLYRARALGALWDIATRGDGPFQLLDARRDLVAAVRGADEALAIEAAGVLAMVLDSSAQTVLFDQAIARSGEARIAFLYAVATSARSMGNFLDAKRVASLLSLVETSTGAEADAAGAAFGAANLPSTEAVEIITK